MLLAFQRLCRMSTTAKVDASDRKGHRRSLYYTSSKKARDTLGLVFEVTSLCGRWILMGTINFLYASSAPQFQRERETLFQHH